MHSFYLFLWIFFIYSFLGWCLEVCFFALNTGKFVNRGFLNGPVCPIYGFGVVIVVLCLTPLMENTLLLFLGSVLLTSLLELGVGFALEKLFHQRWWDYTNEPFNLGGYICLRFSIAWGLIGLFVVDLLHPTVMLLVRLLPHTLGVVLLACFGAVIAVDLAATGSAIARLNRQLKQIDALAGRIRELSDELGENLADKVLEAAEKGTAWKEELDEQTKQLRVDAAERKEERSQERLRRRRQRQQELAELGEVLAANGNPREHTALEKHADWAEELRTRYTFTANNAGDILQQEVGAVFAQVLEHAGVYKRTPEGQAAFLRFVDSVR